MVQNLHSISRCDKVHTLSELWPLSKQMRSEMCGVCNGIKRLSRAQLLAIALNGKEAGKDPDKQDRRRETDVKHELIVLVASMLALILWLWRDIRWTERAEEVKCASLSFLPAVLTVLTRVIQLTAAFVMLCAKSCGITWRQLTSLMPTKGIEWRFWKCKPPIKALNKWERRLEEAIEDYKILNGEDD